MLPQAASSSSDQIGPGNLAVDTNIYAGVYEYSFYYEHTTTSLCTYSNPMIFKCRTKINSNAVVRWHDTARALKGDPQACSHHYAIQNENKPGFLSNCQHVSFSLSLFALSTVDDLAKCTIRRFVGNSSLRMAQFSASPPRWQTP